jgi:hypothetical protein
MMNDMGYGPSQQHGGNRQMNQLFSPNLNKNFGHYSQNFEQNNYGVPSYQNNMQMSQRQLFGQGNQQSYQQRPFSDAHSM